MNNSRILGIYDDEDKLVSSVRSIRDKGIKITDVISPYPVSEIFHLLKLKTRIPVAAFIYGVFGLVATFSFLYWTSVVNYPIVIGGKPLNSLSFIVIIFVMIVNITVLFTTTTFFLRDKKGPGAKPAYNYPGITDDRFVIVVDSQPDMDMETVNRLLKEGGAVEIKQQEVIKEKTH